MYNDENDYELLYLISESNEEAKEVFFEKYKPTVQSYVLKYYPFIKNKGYEMNDLYQEGMLGLNRAIHDFKEQKNVQFNTFAAICIERQILSFIRNVSRDKHRVLNESISIDSAIDGSGRTFVELFSDGDIANPENSFINIEEAESILKEMYFDKKISKEDAVNLIKQRTRNYAKRQYTFFNHQLDVKWFNCDVNNFDNTIKEVVNYIENN